MSENTHAADQEVLSALLSETGNIQIIPRYDERDIGHPNCLVVAPYRESAIGSGIMANVEHYRKNEDSSGFPWEIVLITEQPLTLKAAVEAALGDVGWPKRCSLHRGGFDSSQARPG